MWHMWVWSGEAATIVGTFPGMTVAATLLRSATNLAQAPQFKVQHRTKKEQAT